MVSRVEGVEFVHKSQMFDYIIPWIDKMDLEQAVNGSDFILQVILIY